MIYRVTCLSPTLVSDGQRLSPIDYMVWKDQVNVLDQRRIFKMLAPAGKPSPRLEPYLAQVSRAERLEFAQWGGYAQNYAARRIPLEHPSLTRTWEQMRADSLHIPTFASGVNGPLLPASALKGALRTGLTFKRWQERDVTKVLAQAAQRTEGDRVPRRLAQPMDTADVPALAGDGAMKDGSFKIYYLRTAKLEKTLLWKDSLPAFAEMAVPGTRFEGRWKAEADPAKMLEAVNEWSIALLDLHLTYAKQAGLAALVAFVEGLRFRAAASGAKACLLNLGWGGGFLSKIATTDTTPAPYRAILKALPFYARAIQTGLAFPKTRRVIHLNQQPAALPGWVLFELA